MNTQTRPTLEEAADTVHDRYGETAYVGINTVKGTIHVMFRDQGIKISTLPLQEAGYPIVYTQGHGDIQAL